MAWWLDIIFTAQVFFNSHHGFSIWARAITEHTYWTTCYHFFPTGTPQSLTLTDSLLTVTAYTFHKFIRGIQSTQHSSCSLPHIFISQPLPIALNLKVSIYFHVINWWWTRSACSVLASSVGGSLSGSIFLLLACFKNLECLSPSCVSLHPMLY